MENNGYSSLSSLRTSELVSKARNRNIYIYGVGFGGKRIYETLSSSGVAVSGFCDSSKIGEFCGLPILRSGDLNRNKDFIVIAVLSAQLVMEIMLKLINEAYTEEDVYVVMAMELAGVRPEEYIVDGIRIGKFN